MSTDFVIRSGQTSAVLEALKAGGLEDFSYESAKSAPILAKEKLEIQPLQTISGSIYGATSRFDIPRSTMLRDLVLETNYTAGAGSALGAATANAMQSALVGLNLIESVELRTRSRTIYTMTHAALRDLAESCSVSKSLAIQRRAKMLDQTTGVLKTGALTADDAVVAVSYTPIPGFFSEMIENNMDSGFCEQLQLLVRYNSQAYSGIVRPITGVTNTLWGFFYQPEMSYYNSLRSKNFGRATPLTMLIYDNISEINLATNTSTNTFRIRINNPAFSTYVSIFNNQSSGNAARFAIDNYTVNFTSRALEENVPLLIGTWEQESWGEASVGFVDALSTITRPAAQPLALHWGLSNSRVYNSGAVSYASIDNPEITVVHQTLGTASNYNVVFSHLFWSLMSVDGSNGRILISAAT